MMFKIRAVYGDAHTDNYHVVDWSELETEPTSYRIEVMRGEWYVLIEDLPTLESAQSACKALFTLTQPKVETEPESAMAVWEAYLTDTDLMDSLPDVGACERRAIVYQDITPLADKVWTLATNLGFDDPYDWEFVPLFLTLFHRYHPEQLTLTLDEQTALSQRFYTEYCKAADERKRLAVVHPYVTVVARLYGDENDTFAYVNKSLAEAYRDTEVELRLYEDSDEPKEFYIEATFISDSPITTGESM